MNAVDIKKFEIIKAIERGFFVGIGLIGRQQIFVEINVEVLAIDTRVAKLHRDRLVGPYAALIDTNIACFNEHSVSFGDFVGWRINTDLAEQLAAFYGRQFLAPFNFGFEFNFSSARIVD